MNFDQSVSATELQKEALIELEFGAILEHIAQWCVSSIGKEIIRDSQPHMDRKWVEEELARVDECMQILEIGIPIFLDTLEDIRPLLAKAEIRDAFLTPSEILKVRDVIRLSRLVKQEINLHREQFPALTSLCSGLFVNRLLEKHIRETIDETAVVRDDASTTLRSIRQEIQSVEHQIRRKLQSLLRRLAEQGYVSDEFITQKEGRFVLPLKVEHKGKVSGIIHGVSNSGATVFIEPHAIVELNNALALLHANERREIERILRILTAEIAADSAKWRQSLWILAHLDALLAKAQFARRYGGQKPQLIQNRKLEFSNLYHPLLLIKKGKERVVPLTLTFDSQHLGYLISGPNAGGKTVALKTIGLAIAMALSGIYPVGKCALHPVKIFTSIGDRQSIEQDLSTFSSQMLRLRDILDTTDSETIVLIDEIAAGTDPREGAALAMAIMDALLHRDAYFVVTTHQSSLKSYALNTEKLENASMEFDEENLEPTYHLLPRIPGNSYAFILAQKVGIERAILEKAQNYLQSEHQMMEAAIAQIQKLLKQMEHLKEEIQSKKLEAEKYRQEYERRFQQFRKKYHRLMEVAQEEARDLLKEARRLIEQTVRELREEKITPKEAHRRLQNFQQENIKEKKQAIPSAEMHGNRIQRGSRVKVVGIPGTGIVEEISLDKKSASVVFGEKRMKVPLDRLQIAQDAVDEQNRTVEKIGHFSSVDPNTIPMQIDVRGYFPEEAVLEIDHFIAQALLSSVKTISILHGKGTGVLRDSIHRYLQSNPAVKSFRLADELEGGAGVTIVQLQ